TTDPQRRPSCSQRAALPVCRQRVEHVDNATQMGTAVGRIMAGAEEAYTYTPYFYTNVFDFGYQAIGDLDPSLRTVEDWQRPHTGGVGYYLDEDRRVRGVIMVNMEGRLVDAREGIGEDWEHDPGNLVSRIAGAAGTLGQAGITRSGGSTWASGSSRPGGSGTMRDRPPTSRASTTRAAVRRARPVPAMRIVRRRSDARSVRYCAGAAPV